VEQKGKDAKCHKGGDTQRQIDVPVNLEGVAAINLTGVAEFIG
jgi:hypothetical protein